MLNEDILSFLLPQLDLSYQKFVKKRTKDALIVTTRCVWMLMRSAQPDESDETSPSGLQNCCPNYEDTLYVNPFNNVWVLQITIHNHYR